MPPHPDGAPRPIETRYAGCRFRSRLEARWACFFDTLGIAWEYEPQGYLVGPDARPYLPDFWLPGEKVWAEVKGSQDQLDIALLVDAAFPENGLPATGRSTDDFDREVRMLILGPIARGMTPWTSGGKTLGVVGFGRIGQAVARRGQGFGMRVVYYDLYHPPEEVERSISELLSSLLSCQRISAARNAASGARGEFGK